MEQEPKIEKELVLQALREKGLIEETTELVLVWTRQQELLADQDSTGRKRLEIDLEKQDFYVAAGMIDDALQNLVDLLEQSVAEGHDDLCARIVTKIEEIKTLR